MKKKYGPKQKMEITKKEKMNVQKKFGMKLKKNCFFYGDNVRSFYGSTKKMSDNLTLVNNNNQVKRSTSVERNMVGTIILSQLQSNSNSNINVPALFQPATQQIKHIWATSTWKQRAQLWRRLDEFSNRHNIQHLPLGMRATAMISSLNNISQSSKLTYAKSFRGIAHQLSMQTPLLSLYVSSLNADGAGIPTHQALPASQLQVRTLIRWCITELNSPRLATAIYIMFKTASRWDDVANLQKRSLIHSEQNQLIIEWGKTKTNRRMQYLVFGWTIIEELNYPEMIQIALETFANLKDDEFLCQLETDRFVRIIQRHPLCKELTAHSFKRGAADVLWQAAANNIIDPRRITMLLKHKDQQHDFPSTTLTYAPNKVNLAKAFKTNELTRLL
jgi:hypothetical protein